MRRKDNPDTPKRGQNRNSDTRKNGHEAGTDGTSRGDASQEELDAALKELEPGITFAVPPTIGGRIIRGNKEVNQ